MNLDEKLAAFFEDPSRDPQTLLKPGQNLFGNLYLLRRDIETAFKQDAKWLGVMGIMAGFDLLAKLYAGTDENTVTERFEDFVNKYVTNNNSVQTDVIYQLRNSLLHSFGLYSKRYVRKRDRATEGFDRQDYLFKLLGNPAKPDALVTLAKKHPQKKLAAGTDDEIEVLITEYNVDIYTLKTAFNKAVQDYQNDLQQKKDATLRQNFDVQQVKDESPFFDMYCRTFIEAIAAPTK
jgi:hypothetical protein